MRPGASAGRPWSSRTGPAPAARSAPRRWPATPDGTTLFVVSTPFLIDPLLSKLNYDPLRSFAPICNLVSAPTVIVVNGASPYRTLAGLLDDARAKPGQITMASI